MIDEPVKVLAEGEVAAKESEEEKDLCRGMEMERGDDGVAAEFILLLEGGSANLRLLLLC